MHAFLLCFSQLRKLRMSAGKLTIVHCLSHLRREVECEAAAQVQCRGRSTASDQQSGTRTQTHAAIQAYTQVAKQTHTQRNQKRNGGIWKWDEEPSHNTINNVKLKNCTQKKYLCLRKFHL